MFSDNNSRKRFFQKMLEMLNILLQGMFGQTVGWKCSAGPTCLAPAPPFPVLTSLCYFLVLYLSAINFRFLRLPYPSSPCPSSPGSLPPQSSSPVLHLPVPASPAPSSLSSSSPVLCLPVHHLLLHPSLLIISCSITFQPLTSCPPLFGTAAPRSRGIPRSPPGAPQPPRALRCLSPGARGRWWWGGTGGGPGQVPLERRRERRSGDAVPAHQHPNPPGGWAHHGG